MSEVKEPKALFRRRGWQGKVGSGRPPLWHRWAGEVMGTRQFESRGQARSEAVLILVAACGYEHRVQSILAADGYGRTEVSWRDEVKTASLRCSKCDREAGVTR